MTCPNCNSPTKTVPMLFSSIEVCEGCEEKYKEIWVKKELPDGTFFSNDPEYGDHWVLGPACGSPGCICVEVAEADDFNVDFMDVIVYKEGFDEAPERANGAELLSLAGVEFEICTDYMNSLYKKEK